MVINDNFNSLYSIQLTFVFVCLKVFKLYLTITDKHSFNLHTDSQDYTVHRIYTTICIIYFMLF